MVVKSATKKKLLDLGFSEEMARLLADDRKWGDLMNLSPNQIYEIVMNSRSSYLVDGMTYEQKVELWRQLGRLEIKVGRDGEVDINQVYISVPYLSDGEEYYGIYNFRTGILTPEYEGFRGLGSLFRTKDSIFDWHWVGPKSKIPADVVGNEGYLTILNQLQTKTLAKILKKLENAYFTPRFYQSINRSNILKLWETPEDDWDDLGSLFG